MLEKSDNRHIRSLPNTAPSGLFILGSSVLVYPSTATSRTLAHSDERFSQWEVWAECQHLWGGTCMRRSAFPHHSTRPQAHERGV